MPKLTCLGWYGHGNLGDELILEGIKQLFQGWQIQPLSSDSDGLYPQFSFEAANDCDLFVLGGGELIHKDSLCMPAPTRMKFKNHSLAYKLYNRTFYAKKPWVNKIKTSKLILGCGVDSHELNQNVIEDLAQFDFIGLRDKNSVKTLRQYKRLAEKTDLFFDLVFALQTPKWKENKKYAVVIPTDRDKEGIADKSQYWLKNCLKDFNEAFFVALGNMDNQDYITCKNLCHCANSAGIFRESSFDQVTNLLSGAAMVFPYRLHGLVLSFMVGAKYQFYPYHSKLTRVHDSINGLDSDVIREMQRERLKVVLEAIV